MKNKGVARLNMSRYLRRIFLESEGSLADLLGKTVGKYGGWEAAGVFEKYKDRTLAEAIEKTLELHGKFGRDIAKLDKRINLAVLVDEGEQQVLQEEDEDDLF